MHIKNGQVLTTGGAGIQDANLKQVCGQNLKKSSLLSVQENQQLKEIVNKLRLEKEILLDMLAEVTAELKINT